MNETKPDAGWQGIGVRVLLGPLLVLLTYNPSGASYSHWALTDLATFTPLKALCGALLLCVWVLYGGAALRSLGWIGLSLASLVFGALCWLLASWGILDPDRPRVLAWVALTILGLILGIGLSWSLVRRRITGQVDVDEVDS